MPSEPVPALAPITLRGRRVLLRPLALDDVPTLWQAGSDPALWRLQPRMLAAEQDMRDYVEFALAEQRAGRALPFTVVHAPTGRVIGSTRYMDVALEHRRIEIGGTWYSPQWHGSGVNAEAKLLLLSHAFEALRLHKVVLKTEAANEASVRAILALGAVQEGVFRAHFISEEGRSRDMAYFALFADGWPAAKPRLEQRAARRP